MGHSGRFAIDETNPLKLTFVRPVRAPMACPRRPSLSVRPVIPVSPPMSMSHDLRLIDCEEARHGEAIRMIFNDAIAHSTALYEYQPRTPEVIAAWFQTKRREDRPVIGVEAADGRLLGFASYGSFRAFPAYRYTVEHSVYVAAEARGQGIGRRLLDVLIERAIAQQFHAMVGGIDASNRASIALHEAAGFVQAGHLPEVGYKFGRWLDLAFFIRRLPTPDRPEEA